MSSYRVAFRRAAVGASVCLVCLVLCFGAAQVCKCLPTLGESERATNQGQAERVCCTATIYLLIASFTQTACLSGASGYAGAIKPDWHDSMTRKTKTQGKKKKAKPSKGLRSPSQEVSCFSCLLSFGGPTRPGGNVAAMPCKFAPLVGGFCAEPRAASHGYGTTVRRRWDMDGLKSYLQCAYCTRKCRNSVGTSLCCCFCCSFSF